MRFTLLIGWGGTPQTKGLPRGNIIDANNFVMVLICLGSISAQTFIGKVNPVPQTSAVKFNSNDFSRILAVYGRFS